MPLITFSEMTESEKSTGAGGRGVVDLPFIVFFWFQITLSRDLKRCSLGTSGNKATPVILHGTWTKQVKHHDLDSVIISPISQSEFPASNCGQLSINLNLTWVKNPLNLFFFLASSFLGIADITITFIITQVTNANIFHYSCFILTLRVLR